MNFVCKWVSLWILLGPLVAVNVHAQKSCPSRFNYLIFQRAPEEQAFLSAVGAAPNDDLPKLVYADWVEEGGRGLTAEAIRISIELESLTYKPGSENRVFILNERLNAIKAEVLDEWNRSDYGIFLRGIGTFTDLTSDGMPILRPHSLKRLFGASIPEQHAIVGLTFRHVELDQQHVIKLSRMKLSNLVYLDLTNTQLDDNKVRVLSNPDAAYKSVVGLYLSNNGIGNDGISYLAHEKSPFQNVRSLSLAYNRIRDEGIADLTSEASPFTNLSHLELSENLLTDTSADRLAAFPGFKSLKSIELRNNRIRKVKLQETLERLLP